MWWFGNHSINVNSYLSGWWPCRRSERCNDVCWLMLRKWRDPNSCSVRVGWNKMSPYSSNFSSCLQSPQKYIPNSDVIPNPSPRNLCFTQRILYSDACLWTSLGEECYLLFHPPHIPSSFKASSNFMSVKLFLKLISFPPLSQVPAEGLFLPHIWVVYSYSWLPWQMTTNLLA